VLNGGHEHAHRDGQIKTRPLLLHIGRGKIDRGTSESERESRVNLAPS
jgi:hypothetical protein